MIFGKKWHRFFVTVGRPTPVKARLCRGPSDQEVAPRQRQFSLPLKLWGSSAPSQSTTEPNLAWDNTTKNGGFIRGKTPPDTKHRRHTRHRQHTRHQTPRHTRHQTPPTHQTPKIKTSNTKHQNSLRFDLVLWSHTRLETFEQGLRPCSER